MLDTLITIVIIIAALYVGIKVAGCLVKTIVGFVISWCIYAMLFYPGVVTMVVDYVKGLN